MKKNYLFKMLFFLAIFGATSFSAFAQDEPDEPIMALDTEVETESEVEAEAGIGQTAGSIGLSAGAGANFANSRSAIMLSGSLSQQVTMPTTGVIGGGGSDNQQFGSQGTLGPWPENQQRQTDVNFFLAESESEVESEVEVEVNDGAAIAVAGSAVGTAGVAGSKYTTEDGSVKLWPGNTITSVDAISSTSSKVSRVNIEFVNETSEPVTGSGTSSGLLDSFPMDYGIDSFANSNSNSNQLMLPFDIEYATSEDVPVSQVATDTETEVETEAEAEAETAPGAAGAGASGGTATTVAGDFGVAISTSSIITSVSTSEVNDEEPLFFTTVEPAANSMENTGSGNENTTTGSGFTGSSNTSGAARNSSANGFMMGAEALSNVPTEENGKGLNSFESEAESEVEVEAEVDNGAASVAVIAIAGSGANGSASSVAGSSTSTGSTSTIDENGVAVRENDEVFYSDAQHDSTTEAQPAASAEAEAEAEADASTAVPSANATASGLALGDAIAFGSLEIQNISSSGFGATENAHSQGTNNRFDIPNYGIDGMSNPGSRVTLENRMNEPSGEIEAEVEAEAEAEVGFNAAAAGAGSSAVQGKAGILPIDATTASSSSTSTKVFDGPENVQFDNDSFQPDGNTEYPDFGVDYSEYSYEVETETEVEAEVGYNASAVAVSAAAAGYENIQISTKYATTPYAAAGAAAAGQVVTTSITMPAGNAAGNVTATATAEDSENRGVAVAVAVAGVPTPNASENEQEAESEGAGFVSVSVSIYTDPANAEFPSLLEGFSSSPDLDLGQDEGGSLEDGVGETEAEAESEAEAGYGVAAAAASAAAAGPFAISESFTSTATLDYTAGYDFVDNVFVINEATISRGETNPMEVTITFNGFGYTQFSIQQKNSAGDFEEIGTLDRATPDIWESYIFSVSNVAADAPQIFKIVPLEDPSDEVILTLGGNMDCADIINIPDANFKAALVANTDINTNGDMEIQCFEASSYQGELFLRNQGIADLTGIEAFIQVSDLNVSVNDLTSIDLSENLLLTNLNVGGNDLTSLDLSNNSMITELRASSNDITSLDVSNLDNLRILDVRNNELTSLDVTNSPLLSDLLVGNNQLSELQTGDNQQLSRLVANKNLLTSLDLTGNPGLFEIDLRDNNLTTLDIRNGNNVALTTENFDIRLNPDLTCVSVDTVSYAAENLTVKDDQTEYSFDCDSVGEPNQEPTANCQSFTASIDESGTVTITATDIDDGSFDVDGTITRTISQSSFDCSQLGDNEVTLTITDNEGATDSCTAIVTVVQGTPAVIEAPEDVEIEAAEGSCSAEVILEATATSICGDVEVESDGPEDNIFNVGTTVVTFTFTNDDGSVSSETTNVTVVDTQNPEIECASTQTATIAEGEMYEVVDFVANDTVAISDNCTDNLNYTQNPPAGEMVGSGVYPVTITVTDASGNTAVCDFDLLVAESDGQNATPVAVCDPFTASLSDTDGTVSIEAADIDGGSFDVDGEITVEISQSSFDCSNIGENEVTLTVTDNLGATSSCTAIVTIEDTSAPTIPATIEVAADEDSCEAAVDLESLITDNCSAVTLSGDYPEDGIYQLGTTTISVTATDESGNTVTSDVDVIVNDEQGPTIDCLEEQTEVVDEGDTFTLPDYIGEGLVTVTDNCDAEFTYVQTPTPGEELEEGTYTIVLVATDEYGNESECSFELVVDPVLGVGESNIANFSIYPNPATSQISVKTDNQLTSVVIYNVHGQKVISTSESVINVENMAQGLYLITVTDVEGKTATKKFVKK